MTSSADPLVGQLVKQRYRLQQRVGSGGMSVVYRAVGPDERPLAIKFLRSAFANLPDFVRRFEQEARACALLDHPGCVALLDRGTAFGSPFLAMEYVEGQPLSAEIAHGPIAPLRAIALCDELLRALAHAHGRGVVHRDLKPGNILLLPVASEPVDGSPTGGAPGGDERCLVKLMDFGSAQLTREAHAAPAGGTEVGTPWYMAPEQAAGQPTDQRTDLYSTGVILFAMLTGERPFRADDPMRVLEMHLHTPIPSARALKPEIGLSPELEAVMVHAMQKRPQERFPDAAAFAEALRQVPELRPRRPSSILPALQLTGLDDQREASAEPDLDDDLDDADTIADEQLVLDPPPDLEELTPLGTRPARGSGGAHRALAATVGILLVALALFLLLLWQIGVLKL